ncbi:unnamed protein product [Protopolystoma xenopodis]|uniref:Uncharacterized protein n=1 Tax=Protopolystoma xenopodis TaxID=117903 RepID=A0A3S5BTB3_9PLAT|nr:unnamed protein product [Protopolystoma xenopodis]
MRSGSGSGFRSQSVSGTRTGPTGTPANALLPAGTVTFVDATRGRLGIEHLAELSLFVHEHLGGPKQTTPKVAIKSSHASRMAGQHGTQIRMLPKELRSFRRER